MTQIDLSFTVFVNLSFLRSAVGRPRCEHLRAARRTGRARSILGRLPRSVAPVRRPSVKNWDLQQRFCRSRARGRAPGAVRRAERGRAAGGRRGHCAEPRASCEPATGARPRAQGPAPVARRASLEAPHAVHVDELEQGEPVRVLVVVPVPVPVAVAVRMRVRVRAVPERLCLVRAAEELTRHAQKWQGSSICRPRGDPSPHVRGRGRD